MKNFKILTHSEEMNLSLCERKEYYDQLRKYVLERKLTNTTPGATTIAPHLKKVTNKIASSVIKAFTSKNVEIVCEGTENIPKGPNIYAFTHQGLLDNFAWLPTLKEHSIILHGQEVNKLLLFCQLNTGLVLVKKGDKVNNANAKLDMIRLLLEGHSVVYFPEGTWNLSPNKFLLPLSYGFLDTAKKAQVPVIPAVIEYTYDTKTDKENISKVHIRYGRPIYVKDEDDLAIKLQEYKDQVCTMRWEMIEEKGIASRSQISDLDYINFLKGNYKNLSLGKLDLEKERNNIFGCKDPFYEFFPINDLEFSEDGHIKEFKKPYQIKK